MAPQKLAITTCLSLAMATLSTFGANIPWVEASPAQTQQTRTKANIWFSQGLQKANQQDYQGAVLDFTQAIQIDSQYAEAYYQRGLIYAKYAEGKPLNPNGTLPGCQKINEYSIICKVDVTSNWKQENQRKAITDFSQVIQLNPKYAAAYHHRGLVQKEEQKKIQDFQVAIDLYFQKMAVYLNQKNYEKATDILETIEKLYTYTAPPSAEPKQPENPTGSPTVSPERQKSPDGLMNEARQALRKGNVPTAIQKYREAARIFRDRNEDKRYQQVQQIIREIEQYSKL